MASLKERLSGQLHEMVAERNSLDEQIKQMRSVIAGLESNGNGAAPAPSRRRRGTSNRRRQQQRAPQMSAEERGKQILELIAKKKKPVTSNEVASELGLSNTVTRKHIDNLVKSGGLKDAGVRPREEGSRGGRESKLFALA